MDFKFEFLFLPRSTLLEMMPRGGIQIANTKSIELTESKQKHLRTVNEEMFEESKKRESKKSKECSQTKPSSSADNRTVRNNKLKKKQNSSSLEQKSRSLKFKSKIALTRCICSRCPNWYQSLCKNIIWTIGKMFYSVFGLIGNQWAQWRPFSWGFLKLLVGVSN